MARVIRVCARSFKICSQEKGMKDIETNYFIPLDMRGKTRVICARGWQEVGERSVLCCVWDDSERVHREFRGWLMKAGGEEVLKKLCEEKNKEKP